jgi:hypothetical protein
MDHPSRKAVPWSTLALVFSGIMWFYLLLYFCGVLDVRRYGGVYALAMLVAVLIATLTSPWRAAPRWDAEPTPDTPADKRPPRPPRLLDYAGMAVVGFIGLWTVLRLLEWISVGLTGAVRWPVSSLTGVLAVAAIALASAAAFAVLHLFAWRKLSKSED